MPRSPLPQAELALKRQVDKLTTTIEDLLIQRNDLSIKIEVAKSIRDQINSEIANLRSTRERTP